MYEDDKQSVQGTPDRDNLDDNHYDQYIGAEVLLLKEDLMRSRIVKRQKLHPGKNLVGKSNHNPIVDTRIYTVTFPDGAEMEYAANVIAEIMWAQCDIDRNQMLLMDAITDHKSDQSTVEPADAHITVNVRRHARKTTKGWKLYVTWKDGTLTWERLAELKESNPVEVVEYA